MMEWLIHVMYLILGIFLMEILNIIYWRKTYNISSILLSDIFPILLSIIIFYLLTITETDIELINKGRLLYIHPHLRLVLVGGCIYEVIRKMNYILFR